MSGGSLRTAFRRSPRHTGEAPPWEACCVIHDRAYHAAGPDAAAELSYCRPPERRRGLATLCGSFGGQPHWRLGRGSTVSPRTRFVPPMTPSPRRCTWQSASAEALAPAFPGAGDMVIRTVSEHRRARSEPSLAPGLTFQVLYLPIPYRYHTDSIPKKTAVNPWDPPSFATNESAYPGSLRSAPLTPAAAGTASARRRRRPSAASRPRTRPTARHSSPASPSSSRSAPSPPPPARTGGPSAPGR